MAKRGKVLRDPHFGPGLVIVEGKQYPFVMEGIWRSDVPAKPGLVVNVDFDPAGNLQNITAVPQSQLNQEQAELAQADSRKVAIFESWSLEAGTLTRLALAGLLALSWFFLTAVSLQMPALGKLGFTFWQLLGALNSGNSLQLSESGGADPGFFGLLAILALAGPFFHYFWKDARALFGGFLPLSFMILVAYRISNIHGALGVEVAGGYDPSPASLHYGIFNVLSIGFGTYLSASLATYLAVSSAKQFLGISHLQPMEHSHKMAA